MNSFAFKLIINIRDFQETMMTFLFTLNPIFKNIYIKFKNKIKLTEAVICI
jgi:hypothetical protein